MSRSVRKRRSPEEARLEVLHAAEQRLREHGVSGLNVADVARDCGMSHATVIHHFGNTAGMRRALVEHMTDRLLRDVIRTLAEEPAPDPPMVLRRLYATLSEGGHAKLIAWLSVSGDEFAPEVGASGPVRSLFAELVPVVAERLKADDDPLRTARHIIFLTATSAMGYGLSGELWPAAMGLSGEEVEEFPGWLGAQISRLWMAEE